MTKKNFAAWQINASDFSDDWSDQDKLRFFCRYGVLAPSGHNTQPWLVKFNEKSLLLLINPSRKLPFSGKLAAEPYVSLGAWLETLSLATEGFGYNLSINYLLRDDLIAEVSISGKCRADSSLPSAITARVSNRHPFKKESLPSSKLSALSKSNLSGVETTAVTKAEDIEFLAEKTHTATISVMGQKEFRHELSGWVRNNLTRRHDGMPGYVQNIPLPPSLIAKHVIKHFDISKGQAKKDSAIVKHSAGIVLISLKAQTKTNFLNAGRMYARICIRAQQEGWSSSGVAAAVLDPKTRQEVIERFNMKLTPLALIRLGKTAKRAKRTPRWPLATITK